MKTLSSFLVDDILRRGEDDIWIGEGGGGLGRRPIVRQGGRAQRHKLKQQNENIIEEQFRKEAGVEFSRLRSYRPAWAMQPGGPVRT
jgi:hypothetical protein